MFYGINFLRPASGCFLYLVSKGRSAGCARNDNSVSFHHAMFTHQCRNSEKYGINFFPYSSYWVRQQDALKCILKVRMYFNLRHVSASAMLTKVELPKRQWNFTKDCRRDKETYLRRVGGKMRQGLQRKAHSVARTCSEKPDLKGNALFISSIHQSYFFIT